jgi:membrane protein YqaA with SNARE-associated domain
MIVYIYPSKAYKYVIFASASVLIGAILGYFAGHFVFLNSNGDYSDFARFLFRHVPYFSPENFIEMQLLYSKWNMWIVSVSSFTPIPPGLFAIGAGIFRINLFPFLSTVLISQLIKFSFLAFVVVQLGFRIKSNRSKKNSQKTNFELNRQTL